ncbi:50S ribosomal protein L11 methyltransferase [Castellaniella sp.]|uniref:50S ribosomal protein L11 methyltransferase n=1 Tax=Castellaniella sp. TaxID=1955812 RepID=UPI002AFED441|nr:50S ribosomal protein L11 methyltransferase [Castellaniella sp.]
MRELVLNCAHEQAEPWSDALLSAGALSVSVEDADRDTDHEQALFGEPGTEPDTQAWQRNRLVALLADGDDPHQLLTALDGLAGPAPTAEDWCLRDVPDADWVRLTQSQFGPITVGERIWIVPSWHRQDAGLPAVGSHDGIVRLELDPGLAFGTGSHPTTHLCLEWLSSHVQGGETVLDYGCGSGILAIAARLLGSGPTLGVDIDEQAVLSSIQNAATNHVDIQACLPDDLPSGTHQIVVANILSNPLKILAPMLSARVAPGGSLVLSGVLERQADEVIAAYAPWLPLQVWAAREGWVCLAGQQP